MKLFGFSAVDTGVGERPVDVEGEVPNGDVGSGDGEQLLAGPGSACDNHGTVGIERHGLVDRHDFVIRSRIHPHGVSGGCCVNTALDAAGVGGDEDVACVDTDEAIRTVVGGMGDLVFESEQLREITGDCRVQCVCRTAGDVVERGAVADEVVAGAAVVDDVLAVSTKAVARANRHHATGTNRQVGSGVVGPGIEVYAGNTAAGVVGEDHTIHTTGDAATSDDG